MNDNFDGGPVFPCRIPTGGLHANGEPEPTIRHFGLTKRELFAAILMHSEAVTCGVPGEACEALVEASRAAGTDVIDHMAGNAVQGADALLRALAEPRPEPEPRFPEFNVYGASSDQKDALRTLHTRTWFDQLPDAIRTYVTDAMNAVARVEAGEDDIPF